MESPLQKLIGQQVIVKTGDVSYRGKLVEITEETVSLKGVTGWREVPVERVVAIDPWPPVAESLENESAEKEQ